MSLWQLFFLFFISSSVISADEPVKKEFLVLPHVECNEDFFTGISLLNVGASTTQDKLSLSCVFLCLHLKILPYYLLVDTHC
jgi:hypothetical protein